MPTKESGMLTREQIEEIDGLSAKEGSAGFLLRLLEAWPPLKVLALSALSRQQGEPVGYLPAAELNILQSGHDARLRSAKFGPSSLDGDIPIYTTPALSPAKGELERAGYFTRRSEFGPWVEVDGDKESGTALYLVHEK